MSTIFQLMLAQVRKKGMAIESSEKQLNALKIYVDQFVGLRSW
jgi:hypothetical protein